MSIRPGLSARATLEVRSDDTATQLGSGDVDVLATPILIALCEQASYLAAAPELGPGMTTVGMRVQFDHLAPVAVGGMVTAEATLDKIEGRRLTFTVSASDRAGLVGAGKVTRVVVEVEHFLRKAH